jgi:preprotein translocase subunit SecE
MAFFDKSKVFISEVKVELGKVNWPDRKSVYGSTMVVVATTAVMTVLLWSMDLIFSFLLGIMFK